MWFLYSHGNRRLAHPAWSAFFTTSFACEHTLFMNIILYIDSKNRRPRGCAGEVVLHFRQMRGDFFVPELKQLAPEEGPRDQRLAVSLADKSHRNIEDRALGVIMRLSVLASTPPYPPPAGKTTRAHGTPPATTCFH